MFRFAPSPTGDMHIGNLRVALFNYICSKQAHDQLTVRIEDTDKERNIEGKDKDILAMLALFGISYQHLYYQSNNFKYHLQFASTLLDQKKAFICFCTEEELEAKREKAKAEGKAYRYDGTCENLTPEEILNNPNPFVIRMKKPLKAITFTDKIKGFASFEPDAIDSFVIMRADKYPTYNFACACDDMLQGVTSIIRGEDHMSNTPKQELIRQSLDYHQKIEYAHLPIILNAEGKKMSKRDDASSVQWLLDQGFMPEAILNYLVLLGNHTPKEIFTIEEAISWFKIEGISKSPARFDIDKLRFINREHIKMLDNMELSKRLGYACENLGKLAKVYTEEASTIHEIKQKIDILLAKKELYPEFQTESKLLQDLILKAPYFETFDDFKAYLLAESKLKGKPFFKPLRFWLTGAENGPELALVYPLINPYLKEIVR